MGLKSVLASAALLAGSALVALPANAAVITSCVGCTSLVMPAVNDIGVTSVTEPGYVWTTTNATTQGGAVFGWTIGYGFEGNGSSPPGPVPMAGVNDSTDAYNIPANSMTFTFDNLISVFGGIVNWVPNEQLVSIAAYNAKGNLIDFDALSAGDANIATPNSFIGFKELSADIAKVVLTDGYVGIGALQEIGLVLPTPLPSTWTMLIAGFAGLGFFAYRGSKKGSVALAAA